MKTTMIVYLGIGVLTTIPLFLFNIKKIWVRNTPDVIATEGKVYRFNWVRFCVILLIEALLATFLISGYQQTLSNRYEMAIERLARQHARVLTGQASVEDFKAFALQNGTDRLASSLDAMDIDLDGQRDTLRFQISEAYRPRHWMGQEGFEQTEKLSDDNPIYVMYRLDIDGEFHYIAARLVRVEQKGEGLSYWKYDWIGPASEQQIDKIPMPTPQNGKWFYVE